MLRGKLHIFMALPAVLLALLLFGCSSGEQIPRDNTPQVLIPQADGVIVYESGGARIDASHLEDGYFCASYIGTSDRIKLQATGPDGVTYTYDLAADGSTDVFPLSAGDGSYTVAVYENITDNKYSTVLAQTLNVSLKNEFTPFLYPNQFVNYNEQTKAVAKGAELTEGCATDLEAVTAIYDFVTSTISYDNEKARQASDGELAGYLPDIDLTLETQKGICFDYAALMTCMLRTQRIPTKLQIGFAGDTKHAWISTYLEESGWVENIIYFDGESWSMMDPTFASTFQSGADLKSFIDDSANYILQYSR